MLNNVLVIYLQVDKWFWKWMDGWMMDGWVVAYSTDTLKLWALLILMHIMNTYSIASFIHEFQLFWLMVIAFRNYAAEFGSGRWVHGFWKLSPHCCTALLAQWLSGGSGLISKQTDLILMPCLQLFSPESLSTELLSWTDSHYMVLVFSRPLPLHFSSIQPTAAAKINVFWNERLQVGVY